MTDTKSQAERNREHCKYIAECLDRIADGTAFLDPDTGEIRYLDDDEREKLDGCIPDDAEVGRPRVVSAYRVRRASRRRHVSRALGDGRMSRDMLGYLAGAAIGAALLIIARLMVWGLSALAPVLYPNFF